MRVTILGCGHSGGVPMITGEWGQCDPRNPKNRRRRASIALQERDTTLIVDTSPDLREQCLAAKIQKVDGVLYTHDHADHTHGIDELRAFLYLQKKPIPLYGNSETISFLKSRFGYAFPADEMRPDIYRAFVKANVIEAPFQVGDVSVIPFVQGHGYTTSIGYRFDKVAYSTDVVDLDDSVFETLCGVDVWIVDCIAMDPRPTHSHLAQTLEWIHRVQPRLAYLTHMSHLLDYEKLLKILPEGVLPAYDGLVIEV
jgi:phosphoribosyl 1,2-cyclic phosphate phosphodiesterase